MVAAGGHIAESLVMSGKEKKKRHWGVSGDFDCSVHLFMYYMCARRVEVGGQPV